MIGIKNKCDANSVTLLMEAMNMNRLMVNGDELTGKRLEGWIIQHPRAIRDLEEQTEDLVMLALDHDPNALSVVRDQTEEICKYAISLNPYTIAYIRHVTPELLKYACELAPELKEILTGSMFAQVA